MRELGYVEGKNLVIEWRYADNEYGRLAGLAAEFVRLKVDAILAAGSAAIRRRRRLRHDSHRHGNRGDPVGSGFVKSLARPGGNITGFTNLITDVAPKHLEMLLSMVPKLSHVAVLVNPANFVPCRDSKERPGRCAESRHNILPVEARTPQEIENAFSNMARQNAGAVFVVRTRCLTSNGARSWNWRLKHRLASITAASGNSRRPAV